MSDEHLYALVFSFYASGSIFGAIPEALPITTKPTMQLETVGEIVRVLRSRIGFEQVQLARLCGWRDASPVSRIEKGRIRPTRRTLMKLAENLAHPPTTGTSSELRGWLFLAAGILPTANEVDNPREALPDIDTLPHPAWVRDFGWHLWRSNQWFNQAIGLPERHIGRNYLEMFFEDGSSIRKHLGEMWYSMAPPLVAHFLQDIARFSGRRWYRELLDRLLELPDFPQYCHTQPDIMAEASGWYHTVLEGGKVGSLQFHLSTDSRLIVHQVIAEDLKGMKVMSQLGAVPSELGSVSK